MELLNPIFFSILCLLPWMEMVLICASFLACEASIRKLYQIAFSQCFCYLVGSWKEARFSLSRECISFSGAFCRLHD